MTEQSSRPRPSLAGWIAAAVMLLIAAVAGVYGANMKVQLDDVELRLVDAVTKLQASEERLVGAASESDAIRSNLALLSAPDTTDLKLAGKGTAADATGRVFASKSKGLLFSATKLPALPEGRTYQLWLLSRGVTTSVGLVHSGPDGNATAAFDLPPDAPELTGVSVTVEPEGGSPAPTGAVVMAVR